MPAATVKEKPSLVSEIGALAGLYRTVFWMMGKKAKYGRVFPPEAEMGSPPEPMGTTELFLATQYPSVQSQKSAVEVGFRE